MSKRQAREKQAKEQVQYAIDERVLKANAMASKIEITLEQVKKQ